MNIETRFNEIKEKLKNIEYRVDILTIPATISCVKTGEILMKIDDALANDPDFIRDINSCKSYPDIISTLNNYASPKRGNIWVKNNQK